MFCFFFFFFSCNASCILYFLSKRRTAAKRPQHVFQCSYVVTKRRAAALKVAAGDADLFKALIQRYSYPNEVVRLLSCLGIKGEFTA
uniref:Putative secreted protein n=1 Tax=Rhipicephalus microplus TaxID=6941 RepID=A0A6M2DAI4_RHIMP